jgi:hypothetical protein
MLFDPPVFAMAPIGSVEPSACSPAEPPPPWTGVVITAPRRAAADPGEALVLPVCGFWRVEALAAMRDSATLVVRLSGLDMPFEVAAPVVDEGPADPIELGPAPPPLDPALYEGVLTASHFVIDAARYLPRPPPGRYHLTVGFGAALSEPALVEVTR